jgi:hypothetical protein
MAPPIPDDPVLPGATWRPLSPQEAARLEALVEAARAADGKRRFERLLCWAKV